MIPAPRPRVFHTILALVPAAALLVGCTADDADAPATVTETVSTAGSATETTTGETETSTADDDGTRSADADGTTTRGAAPQATVDNRPRGHLGAPNGRPTPLNRTIARCAHSSEGLYQEGTTWFTDGTSGWTEYCAARFWDGPPPAWQEPEAPGPAAGGDAGAGTEADQGGTGAGDADVGTDQDDAGYGDSDGMQGQ